MNLEASLRISEILLSLSFLQQSFEHVFGSNQAPGHYCIRAGLSLCLLAGFFPQWVLAALSVHSVMLLHRFAGPYNGGADRMGNLVLYCLCLAHFSPQGFYQELAFGYLGMQVILSYFISGQVKLMNPQWRNGRALQDVFLFSAYPVSKEFRNLASYPKLLWTGSWFVMLFELCFPLSVLNNYVLYSFMAFGAGFHLANACLFGLNRFLWVWLASYPSLIWLQMRIVG